MVGVYCLLNYFEVHKKNV